MGMFTNVNMVHIHADIPSDSKWSSNVHDASEHAAGQSGHTYIGIDGISDLEHVFKRMMQESAVIDKMDFHTHGSGGSIALGREHLTAFNLDRFRNKGFDMIFRAGTRIFFHGCNVAEGPDGELFLAEFGAIFLRNAGGRVGASTSAGFVVPIFTDITGKIIHFTGNVVYAHVFVGGAVSLENNRHLQADHIRDGIRRMQDWIRQKEQGKLSAAESLAITNSKAKLSSASGFVAASRPSYRDIYWGHVFLADAGRALGPLLTAYISYRYWEGISVPPGSL